MRTKAPFNRKQAQLCSEVEQIVTLILGSSVDERLQQLSVHSVEAASDGACLTVYVIPLGELELDASLELMEALEGARAWVRQQVACDINRKRTPELRFQLLFSRTEEEP